ncbi:MAG TPA: phytanoyl-CoA dioxygenase family protein [Planctomycetes bacterium]|nr:phytanoyl-CoA dioxygenase family protein [Planctomycetota bacterium]
MPTYDRAAYERQGFLILPDLLTAAEAAMLRTQAQSMLRSDSSVMHKGDSTGKTTLLKMWNSAGEDPFGLTARDQRLVDCARQLLGEAVYCYSHKMTIKEPREGGAWEWHQDYGYWYNYGCLAPSMLSIWIAIDRATQANGCLQILEGSHKLGRVEHLREAGQYNCDRERVEQAQRRFRHRFVELEPGSAVVFDCNLLHTSAANTSELPRWGYICSYNTLANEPYKRERDYGHDTDLRVVQPGEALRRFGHAG